MTQRAVGTARESASEAKRALDVVVSGMLLMVLGPLLALLYVLVAVTSPGGGIFRQIRLGKDQEPFLMYKFRTMRVDGDQELHREFVRNLLLGAVEPVDGMFKLCGDPRITRLGAFLRRTSLDELPQLLNVFRGDMSLVGPRPALPWEVQMFPAWAMSRFTVMPGMTGLWQVSGRSQMTMIEALRLDVEYVRRCTFWFDLLILVRTGPALLRAGAR